MITLEISTHGGDVDNVKVENYDVEAVVNELNDDSVHSIAFGQNIYSRIDIKNIKVLE